MVADPDFTLHKMLTPGQDHLYYYLIKPKFVMFWLWTSLSPIKIGG